MNKAKRILPFRRTLSRIVDNDRGNSSLAIIDKKAVPFEIKNMFMITSSTETGCVRGGHAHKEAEQFIILTMGLARIKTANMYESKTFDLNKYGLDTLFIPSMTWVDIEMNRNSALFVFQSMEYDKEDLIYNKDFIIMPSVTFSEHDKKQFSIRV